MAKNIVYLIGAGASYNCLPIVSDMHERMLLFMRLVSKSFPNDREALKEFYDIIDEIKYFGTPDTLARRYYLSDNRNILDEKLIKLKNLLSCFLLFEQYEKDDIIKSELFLCANKLEYIKQLQDEEDRKNEKSKLLSKALNDIDSRYLSFISTISKIDKELNYKFNISNNVTIISWNYDLQIERAIQEYCNEDLLSIQNRFSFYPKLVDEKIDSFNNNFGFSVLKLNGIGAYYKSFESVENSQDESMSANILFDIKNEKLDFTILGKMKDILIGKNVEYKNLLNFAWEHENIRVRNAREFAKKRIKNANIIVLIGYSFPDFNRLIDKEIFSEIKFISNPRNTKIASPIIYLHDPNSEIIKQKLNGVKPNLKTRVVEVQNHGGNFIIPYEFWEN